MNYKLAKQLKEAGFPQNKNLGDKFYCVEVKNAKEENLIDMWREKGFHWSGNHIKIPTLSELIDACGDEFEDLSRFEIDKGWIATATRFGKEKCSKCGETSIKMFDAEGKTPKIAVAKLWLKSNK